MSPTNPVYQRFYKTAGPTLVRWAGLQTLLLGAEGAPLRDGLAVDTPETAPQTSLSPGYLAPAEPGQARPVDAIGSHPAATATHQAPTWQGSDGAARWTPQAGTATAGAPRHNLAPSRGAPPDWRPEAEPAPVGTSRLDVSPAAGAQLATAGRLTPGSPPPTTATRWQPRTDEPVADPSGAPSTGGASRPPTATQSIPASLSGALPLTPAAAASPALGALLEAATRRSRRQEVLLALATAHFPTAQIPTPTPQTHQPQAPTPQAAATQKAPAIRFTAPTAPAPPRLDNATSPAGEDDFLYEERLRTTLGKILRTDALRHGLQLGER